MEDILQLEFEEELQAYMNEKKTKKRHTKVVFAEKFRLVQNLNTYNGVFELNSNYMTNATDIVIESNEVNMILNSLIHKYITKIIFTKIPLIKEYIHTKNKNVFIDFSKEMRTIYYNRPGTNIFYRYDMYKSLAIHYRFSCVIDTRIHSEVMHHNDRVGIYFSKEKN